LKARTIEKKCTLIRIDREKDSPKIVDSIGENEITPWARTPARRVKKSIWFNFTCGKIPSA